MFFDEPFGFPSCLRNRVGTELISVEEAMEVEGMNELTEYDVSHPDILSWNDPVDLWRREREIYDGVSNIVNLT